MVRKIKTKALSHHPHPPFSQAPRHSFILNSLLPPDWCRKNGDCSQSIRTLFHSFLHLFSSAPACALPWSAVLQGKPASAWTLQQLQTLKGIGSEVNTSARD